MVVGLIVALLGVGGVYARRVQSGPSYPDSWDPRVADIVSFVEGNRHLKFRHPVYVDFLTEDDFKKLVTNDGGSVTEDDRKQMQQQVAELRALGLVQGDIDLLAQSNTLRASGALAFYDHRDDRVRIRGTELTLDTKVTVAHELTHALQDQHFDLSKLDRGPSSAEADAFRTIVEGDARRVERAYIDQLPADDKTKVEEEEQKAADEARAGITSVPDVMVTSFAAPYELGPPFLDMLEAKGGLSEIDRALDNPPKDQSQILDPHDYLESDPPSRPPTPSVPDAVGDGEAFGALNFLMMLSSRIEPHRALAVSDLWSGDVIVSYKDGGRSCVALRVRADSQSAADRLKGGLDEWQQAMPHEADATVSQTGHQLDVRSCDPGSSVDMAITGKPSEMIAFPVIRLYLLGQAYQAGIPAEKATCVADRVIEGLTVDEANGKGIDRSQMRGKVLEARTSCGA